MKTTLPMTRLVLVCLLSLFTLGCGSVITTSAPPAETLRIGRLVLPPFTNATDDEHASRAITEMTGSALVRAGIPLYQTEELVIRTAADAAQGADGRYAEIARSVGATHLLVGTVHEYRYKTDLDGDPAVGITMRLVDAATGETVWQGTSGNVGYAFASLTSAATRAVNQLVGTMPVSDNQLRRHVRLAR